MGPLHDDTPLHTAHAIHPGFDPDEWTWRHASPGENGQVVHTYTHRVTGGQIHLDEHGQPCRRNSAGVLQPFNLPQPAAIHLELLRTVASFRPVPAPDLPRQDLREPDLRDLDGPDAGLDL